MAEQREYVLYRELAAYLRLQYPKVRFHYDYAGLAHTKAQAGQMKAIQHSKGFPDLTIINPNGGILFLELKAEGNNVFKKNGELISDEHVTEQAMWLYALSSAGFSAYFATGFDQAKFIIDTFLTKKQ